MARFRRDGRTLCPARLVVATLDGQKVLQKEPLNTIFQRGRTFIGPPTGRTTRFRQTCEPRAPAADRRRGHHGPAVHTRALRHDPATQARAVGAGDRTHGDSPVRLETRHLVSVEAAGGERWRTVRCRARGKAWAVGAAEPADWMIDKTDPIGNREGAPGLFINAPSARISTTSR